MYIYNHTYIFIIALEYSRPAYFVFGHRIVYLPIQNYVSI